MSFAVACCLAGAAGCSFVTDLSGLTTGADGGIGPAAPESGGFNPDATSAQPAGGNDAGEDGGSLGAPSEDSGPGNARQLDDGAASAADDGAIDAGEDAGIDAGCGAVDTVTSCGACGVACDVDSGQPSCNGTTCSYACNAGHSDCDKKAAPDTNGCECATPACCGTGCETTHSDGFGQSFYDCNPAGTYTSASALAACVAFAHGDASMCSDNWTCSGDSNNFVCFDPTNNSNDCTTCWGYAGANKGKVMLCECPWSATGPWN